jgi:hypothetical protein
MSERVAKNGTPIGVIVASATKFFVYWGVIVVMVAGLVGGLVWLTQFSWNYAVAPVFQVTPITFWQALALIFLAQLFFKSWNTTTKSK